MNFLKTLAIASCTIATLTSPVISYAKDSSLLIKVHPYHHQLPDTVLETCSKKENCPEIEISYIISSQDWVNKIINQEINDFIIDGVAYQPITQSGYSLKVPNEITTALNDFANTQLENDISVSLQKTVQPTYLGHAGSLELFEISGYDYLGGAHGIGFNFFSILDSESKKSLTLDELLTVGAKSKLKKLVEAEFDKWLITHQEDPTTYKQSWTFSLTHNVTFGKDGLIFLYQPYEITPYAYGMPELTVSYDKLDNIIKPKYLKMGKQL